MPPVERYRHGTRARYVAGCRCRPCTHANVVAYHEREAAARAAAAELGTERTETHCVGVEGDPCPHGTKLRSDSTGNICHRCRKRLVWNGLVPTNRARRHLRLLSKHGIGRRAVHDATDISDTVLHDIKTGRKKRIRRNTERLILAVDAGVVADGALVDAAPVWRMIEKLRERHGYALSEIARRLGQKGPRLQLGARRVTARNALKIEKLLRDADGDILYHRPARQKG